MKKLLSFWTIVAMLFVAGCKNNDEPTNNPTPNQPVITIEQVAVEADSFSFEVTTTAEGTLGYAVVAEGFTAPKMDEWFAANSAEVADKTVLTIENLNDNTNYTLYAILRAKNGGVLSAPKNLTFTTLDDGVDNPITIDNVGYTNATFTINIPGDMLFQCIDKAYLDTVGQTPESYISTAGIGIPDKGPITVNWENGGRYGNYEMRMREDDEYYVIAAHCDASSNINGQIYVKAFRTLRRPTTDAGITTEFHEISSTSVTIRTTPDDSVTEYYVYVNTRTWVDGIVGQYGQSMLNTLVKYPSSYAWHLTARNEDTWKGLTPDTNYCCLVLVKDRSEAEALFIYDFKTSAKHLGAPNVEISITEDEKNPHNTLALNIISADAASVKVVFRPSIDVMGKRNEGLSDENIVSQYGVELTEVQIAAVNNTGLSLVMEDLWPEVEYTALVSVKNIEETETFKATTHTTPAQAPATRVESELFTSLLGKWSLTYTLVQENLVEATVTEVVTIAQGVDDKTNKDYRDQNRLVILGFPFEVSAQGQYNEIPVYTPDELRELLPNYYAKAPALVYRDYGPKIFLEIAEGDKVTVPTSKGNYLYNWAEAGAMYFYGCDYENQFTAPAPFPVTISADGNTITIGAYHSGEEFGFGIYRPSVFLDDYKLEACALGDIVLTRVK